MHNLLHLLPLPLFSFLASSAPAPAPEAPSRTPNIVTIQNSCPYDVWLEPFTPARQRELRAKIGSSTSWTYDLVGNYHGTGPCLKASKSEIKEGTDFSNNILQLEVSYSAEFAGGMMWYDLSLEACTGLRPDGGADCPGWDMGLRVTSGENCTVWDCKPREYCPSQVYWYHHYDEMGKSACSGCSAKEGVLFELCYSNREGQTQMGSA